ALKQPAVVGQVGRVERLVGAAARRQREREAEEPREIAKLHTVASPIRTRTRKSHRRGARGTSRAHCSAAKARGTPPRSLCRSPLGNPPAGRCDLGGLPD